LLPETYFLRVPKVPAIADDSVILRCQARQHGRLGSAGYRWEWAPPGRRGTNRCNPRCMAEQGRGEPNDVDDAKFIHRGRI
jgi:hypothetical protein